MSALAAPFPGAALRPPVVHLGRAFVHPLFDLLIIGSGLSLALTPLFLWSTHSPALGQRLELWLPFLVLVSNSAHFAVPACACTFYVACLALGYLLFEVWPFAYVLLGYGIAESMLLVAAVINVHHFVVDAFIWKLRQAPNYRIVTHAV